MMIDNFDLLADLLSFESGDDFYFLQIIQRKKENAQLGSNNRVIKSYYIGSKDYLLDSKHEIISLCDLFNARAYINLNKRSYEKLAFHHLKCVTDHILNKDYKSIKNTYNTVCGQYSNDKNKKWIIDLDGDDLLIMDNIIKNINNCTPAGDKVILRVPTKNGIHLITSPFNLNEFNHAGIQIHKNNPTILYCK